MSISACAARTMPDGTHAACAGADPCVHVAASSVYGAYPGKLYTSLAGRALPRLPSRRDIVTLRRLSIIFQNLYY